MSLPTYRSQKTVNAFKIKKVELASHGGALLYPEEDGVPHVAVDAAYVKRHDPKTGGYYVRYPDGYESWSPAEAFESGFTRVD